MKRLAYFALGATLLMTIGASLQPAQAVCVSPRLVSSGYSYVYTPGYESLGGFNNSSVSADFVGSFWGIGSGNLDAEGFGIDNGSFQALGGWVGMDPGYPAYINTTWAANTGIDGCIDFASAPRCMAILLMDNDANTGSGAFALLTDHPDELLNFDFGQPGGGPINLVTVPSLSITGSVRTSSCSDTTTQSCGSVLPACPAGEECAAGACSVTTGQACDDCPAGETCVDGTGVDVSVGGISLSTIEAGLYLDPDCPQPTGAPGEPTVIEGYQVYAREVPRGAPAPTDTHVENWTPVGPVTPLDTVDPPPVSVSCTGETDQYLAVGIVFDSGSGSSFVSGNSTRSECGANLADPGERIQRKPRNREVPRSRSRGR